MAKSTQSADVAIVGGGPAGLALAIALRQHGLNTLLADSAEPPIDKPCGEGLMPDALVALERLGIVIPANECYRFRGIRFLSEALSADADFPVGRGVGIRRTKLQRVLYEHAKAAGVKFCWGSVATGLHPEGIRLGNTLVSAPWIVGADGGGSRVRGWAGLDRGYKKRTRFAFRRHYRVAPWTDCMEIYWGPRCQIYMTPVAADEVCVAVISRNSQLRLDELCVTSRRWRPACLVQRTGRRSAGQSLPPSACKRCATIALH